LRSGPSSRLLGLRLTWVRGGRKVDGMALPTSDDAWDFVKAKMKVGRLVVSSTPMEFVIPKYNDSAGFLPRRCPEGGLPAPGGRCCAPPLPDWRPTESTPEDYYA